MSDQISSSEIDGCCRSDLHWDIAPKRASIRLQNNPLIPSNPSRFVRFRFTLPKARGSSQPESDELWKTQPVKGRMAAIREAAHRHPLMKDVSG